MYPTIQKPSIADYFARITGLPHQHAIDKIGLADKNL